MPHESTLIFTIAASFGLALVLGFLAARLKLPVLVGYMVAGILVGPLSPGLVVDVGLSHQLAEIGVILLMFGVGLHFSLADLFSVRRIALPGALIEIPLVTALGAGLATWWGWSLGGALVFGLCLSVASTVVLVRAMETHGQLKTMNGHIAIGWLVVEDLAMVLVLVLLPPLAGVLGGNSGAGDVHTLLKTLVMTLIKVAGFIALMMVVGRKVFPWLLWQVAHTGSRELFNLCVVAAAIGIAYGASAWFGVSIALGAFFAGIVLRESSLSYRAAQESLPLRNAFSVLFFVSVGMLFDPHVLLDNPLGVLAALCIIMVGKSMLAFTLIRLLGYPLNTAMTVAMGLAQIGEFSFILAGLGMTLGLLPMEGFNLVLAGALISIALNPLVFRSLEPLQRWLRARSRFARFLEQTDDPLAILPTTLLRKN
ncbi:MAG: cation:proton antiporter [Pseudomonadales bacterium]